MSCTTKPPKFKLGDRVVVTMENWYRQGEEHVSGVVVKLHPWRYVVRFEEEGLHGFDENEIELCKKQVVRDIIKDL